MKKQLTAQTATITTASVEVKTLTISGKQVTLAVFRQLPLSPIVTRAMFSGQYVSTEDPTVEVNCFLNGEAWGVVNYCTKDCDFGDLVGNQRKDYLSGKHLHTVWELDGRLYRSVDYPPCDPGRWLDRQHRYEFGVPEPYFCDVIKKYDFRESFDLSRFSREGRGAVEDIAMAYRDYVETYPDRQKIYQELSTLPQLFIAV